ncbi:MAG: ATPase domain-containing protein, partial [Rhodocyclaceae bacterium]|nr:ATPase domain-containing protein [Rhodocyclaceae bacterium]
MVKPKSIYSCTECGASAPKWQGQCPGCAQWNTLVEAVAEIATSTAKRFGANFAPLAASSKPQDLATIRPREEPRLATGVEEFDRVLGGGLVAGGVVLIGGDPGIGKSTLLLQALARLAEAGQPVLYVSGEESGEQIALRANRLQLPAAGLRLLAEINLEKIIATLQDEKPLVAVIDSIQTLWSDALQSAPGSVAQVRECAAQLTRFAKQTGVCIIL